MENQKELLQLKLENARLKIRLIQMNIAMANQELIGLQQVEKELEGQLAAVADPETPTEEV